MTAEAGIRRTTEGLMKTKMMIENSLTAISGSESSVHGSELRNQLLVSLAVVNDSLQQKENRGCFYREDLTNNVELKSQI